MDLNLLYVKASVKCSWGKEYNCAVFEWTLEKKKKATRVLFNY